MTQLRCEQARLMGYNDYAEYALSDRMAKNPRNVSDFMRKLIDAGSPVAVADFNAVQEYAISHGFDEELQRWDFSYWSEKLKQDKYSFDAELLRPYFQLEKVRQGIFDLYGRLYGLTFKDAPQIETYHPDVRAYEVYDGSRFMGVLYLDMFPRESKRSGAWMTEFRSQCQSGDGQPVIPVISLVFNFPRPVGDRPSLLNFDEAETFFHEFGHSLHGLLSRCRYRSLGGTNVSRDFVELPSQIMENWASHPEMMRLYAQHYQTGDTIPEKLIQKIQAAANYGQGFMNTELIAASLLDMDYHCMEHPDIRQPAVFEAETMRKYGLIPSIISRYHSQYFQHIFTSSSGYSAGYYSYTWSAVLDADAFACFKEKGIFSREVADAFRKNILEKGNTEDPAVLYRNFRGEDPTITPLLRKRGLLK